MFENLKEKRRQRQRIRERERVEKEYAKTHPARIEVVQPETRSEMRLTHKGKFEMGSDGELTIKGRTDRLSYRYNTAIWVLVLLIIAVYLFFFFVN
ncbi:hypothetical protein [Convivina intestini]|uniref:Uncharacterized protein n=1 Tax=Convivina intestini TaxID=1505726 RepID=A0A2U1DCB6_9LACO|nr:hypothetical protein [Convivina intestini]PVY85202.1 hypothetical protein C7384_10218 [Convivina intestini]CAH1852406.1 hypothetical protein R077811_00419 [Convivina intestini]CAH1854580.1 hypothetical protein R078131_01003 [Convivina intestini]SDC00531.1 hypothetical protein SAMN05216341_10919 [Leuconostocaceae bacterium R-53105]